MNGFILTTRRGFTLLFAVLVGSIVLALGLGIFNIVYREFQLSALTRDSDTAFFAADAGMECGLYWEFSDKFIPGITSNVSFTCAGVALSVPGTITGPANNATTTWTFQFPVGQVGSSAQSCVWVTVAKNPSNISTYVQANGHNNGGQSNCVFQPRIVERTLEA